MHVMLLETLHVQEFGSPGSGGSVPLGNGAVTEAGLQRAGPGTGAGEALLSRAALPGGDDPLSAAPGTQWQQRFVEEEIRAQIQRDVERTHPDLHFFRVDGDAASGYRTVRCGDVLVVAYSEADAWGGRSGCCCR